MTLLPFLHVAAILLLANIIIFGGVFFMNGQLLPDHLGFIYEKTTYAIRLIIALALFFSLGNILIAFGYNKDAAFAAPMNIIASIIIQIALTVVVLGGKLSPMLIPASLVLLAGAYWVYSILSTTSSD